MSELISRKAVIDAISTWDKFGVDERVRIVRWRDGLEPYVKLRDVITAIVNTPSAQPERKKGKWIEYEQEFMLEGHTETVQKTVRECSVCTAKIAGMVGIMNFCPYCGADMRGGKDG